MISIVSNLVGYVAGPLTTGVGLKEGKFNSWAWERNVRRAERVWLRLQHEGFPAICVHTMGRYMFGEDPEAHAIAAGLILLERCDFVQLVEGWQDSNGTLGEIRRARERSMPVFETIDEAVEWRATRVTQVIEPDPERDARMAAADDVFGPSGILHCGKKEEP
jgi:hypothetical protein